MKNFAKIIDEETKKCIVGVGTDSTYYLSEGMSEMEVEQAYDGKWYLVGYAPEKPQEVKEQEVRAVRNQYLSDTDKYMISDFPVSNDEKDNYKAYRQYLRDYTEQESWWENNPQSFEEWEND